MRSHVKLPAGRARNPLTRIHIGNTKSIDVLRPPGIPVLQLLKENAIETFRIVMLGSGRWTGYAGPSITTLTEKSIFAALAGWMIPKLRRGSYFG